MFLLGEDRVCMRTVFAVSGSTRDVDHESLLTGRLAKSHDRKRGNAPELVRRRLAALSSLGFVHMLITARFATKEPSGYAVWCR
jgi:hypothetical protein